MKVVLIGSVSSSWHALRGLLRGGVEIVGVLGLDESHAARVSDFRTMREQASEHGVPFQAFHKIAEPGAIEFVKQRRPDLLFVIGLSQLAPPELLALAPAGAIGFHPTPLPRGRGRAPVVWTILLNERAAVNLFFLNDEADAGDIIDQRPVEVRPDDYAQDLIDRTNAVLEQMIVDLAPAIRSGKLPRTPQDHTQATWYGKRTPADGLIDWSRPAQETWTLIRAASRPYPGAFTFDRGEKRIIWRAEWRDGARIDHVGTVGQVARVDAKRGVLVACGDGDLLWLTEVTDGDDNAVPHDSFRVGARLGTPTELMIRNLEDRVAALEGELRTLREGQSS